MHAHAPRWLVWTCQAQDLCSIYAHEMLQARALHLSNVVQTHAHNFLGECAMSAPGNAVSEALHRV